MELELGNVPISLDQVFLLAHRPHSSSASRLTASSLAPGPLQAGLSDNFPAEPVPLRFIEAASMRDGHLRHSPAGARERFVE